VVVSYSCHLLKFILAEFEFSIRPAIVQCDSETNGPATPFDLCVCNVKQRQVVAEGIDASPLALASTLIRERGISAESAKRLSL